MRKGYKHVILPNPETDHIPLTTSALQINTEQSAKNGCKKQPVPAPSMPRINAWFQSCFANFQVKSLHVIVDLLQGGARGNPFGYTLFTSVCQSQTIQTRSKTCQFYPMELNANPSSTEQLWHKHLGHRVFEAKTNPRIVSKGCTLQCSKHTYYSVHMSHQQ